jgi:hypothetical protein
MRIIFYGMTGVIAGMLAWPFAELILYYQADFPTLLLFNTVLGVTIGFFIGGCFGTSEGIVSVSKEKIKKGMITGGIVGIIGGFIGLIAGQAALLFIGTTLFHSSYRFQKIGFPLSKALGWAVFGICIGMAHGIRSKSGAKLRNGILGGFIGGMIGGSAVEYIRILSPENIYGRLVGLVVLGLLIGIFYGIIENKLAKATLYLLSGRLKNREYPLTQKLTSVGKSEKTEIGIPGYGGVADVHVTIARERDGFTLTDAAAKKETYVNDSKTAKTRLKDGDIIRIGDAQFQFRKK